MTVVLRADSIAKRFGPRQILTAATLRAIAGEITLLIGRNGIGKSTLLKIAAGVVAPDQGTVTFAGRCHTRARLSLLARHGLFYLPDRELFSASFVLAKQLRAIASRFATGDIEHAATACGIASHLQSYPMNLSSGERRRAELAAALIRKPTCLLADEPYRNIDPQDRDIVAAALKALAASGCAVVITGHEIADVLAIATRVTWCTAGTTLELGSAKEAMENWGLRREYLGRAGLRRET